MPNWKKLIVSGSSANLNDLTVTTTVTAPTLTGSLLRLDENGTGLRMTNIGAFDNSSGDFRIFSTQDLILSTNGSNGVAITIDKDTKAADFVGAITASAFIGDGSGLTNISTDVADVATVTDTFTSVTTKVVSHNFNSKNVLVTVYNDSDEQILPSLITTTNTNQVTVSFDSNTTGRVVVAKGGHLVSGTAQNSDLLDDQNGTYYLNYNNFNSVPSGIISGSAQIDNLTRYEENISGNTSYTINHGLNEEYPVVQIYDTSKVQVLPAEIKATNNGTVELTFDSNFTGKVVVKK